MELMPDGDYRHKLYLVEKSGGFTAYVIRMFQPDPSQDDPRTGIRFDMDGNFANKTAAYTSASSLVRRIIAGEANATTESLSEIVGQYKLLAGVAARTDRPTWEGTLSIKSRKPENKGAVQDFNSAQSALRLNTFPEASTAAKFALQYGRNLINGSIGGLKI